MGDTPVQDFQREPAKTHEILSNALDTANRIAEDIRDRQPDFVPTISNKLKWESKLFQLLSETEKMS